MSLFNNSIPRKPKSEPISTNRKSCLIGRIAEINSAIFFILISKLFN
ncbi:hypothetical protein OVS_01450 [Mycoplasma ovis str. Michigan]|uniref:Uncharacterized protein n=1 Tax=Mycoplasma ovis str. Michigan TaxID=1415773 RepID=A0ABM5P198_9MOLU|nr:hypothetical protein OVS_01450 [Mycoplasma ovis str. Michigan]